MYTYTYRTHPCYAVVLWPCFLLVGITEALSALSTAAPGANDDAHPEKRQKALHKAYVDKMMPVVKQDFPGLRMTQYQEKIFDMWKTSPENPRYVASLKAREDQKKATLQT